MSNERKETIAVDFDGVIHGYAGYSDKIDGMPVDGAFNFLDELLDSGFIVVILSARARSSDQIKLMKEWFAVNNFSRLSDLEITNEKPTASMYIDDRA